MTMHSLALKVLREVFSPTLHSLLYHFRKGSRKCNTEFGGVIRRFLIVVSQVLCECSTPHEFFAVLF